MKKPLKEGNINVGDIVTFIGRDPMPEAMQKATLEKQVVSVAEHPYYEFESGWSVNVDMGDHIHLVTPHPKIPNRAYRRFATASWKRRARAEERMAKEAIAKRDAKEQARILAKRRAERRALRKAGLPIYPKKKSV